MTGLKMQRWKSKTSEIEEDMTMILTKTRKLSLAIKSVAMKQFMKNYPKLST
jgi:hypothetical protein